jgi:hypothetical protein
LFNAGDYSRDREANGYDEYKREGNKPSKDKEDAFC